MLTVVKSVYYCEFCKRHRITASAIEKHEPRCIYNPDRSACGWHEPHFRIERPRDHVEAFIADPDVNRLRDEMDECPACMLAVIVQARKAGLDDESAWDFDYKAEIARYRETEQRNYAF